jgi:hypothetical protein
VDRNELRTLVVAYDDADIALTDYDELKRGAEQLHRTRDYEAAVIRRDEDGFEVLATTVPPRADGTLLGVMLGLFAAVVISPALPVAIVGASVGAGIGTVVDRVEAFKHADRGAVRQLVNHSAASLIIITDGTTADELRTTAIRRERRVVVPIEPADIDALEQELRRDNAGISRPGQI